MKVKAQQVTKRDYFFVPSLTPEIYAPPIHGTSQPEGDEIARQTDQDSAQFANATTVLGRSSSMNNVMRCA